MTALVYLVWAALAALAAERLRPTGVPWATPAALLAGIVGSVLLALPLGDVGPHLLEVAVLPAAGGALLGVVAGRLAVARAARGGGAHAHHHPESGGPPSPATSNDSAGQSRGPARV